MDFSAIKTLITQNIRTNNNEDITGSVLQQVLLGIIETLGDDAINDLASAIEGEGTLIQNIRQTLQNLQNGGYLYGGVAVPGTSPGTPLVSTFFIATQAGTYNYFIDQNDDPITLGYDALYILTYEALENHYWEYQKVCDMGDGVYDISANHNGATYADLAAALGTNGANVPEGIRKGGMSVKFVHSLDNKYVQSRLMADAFTTDLNQWQGTIDEIKAGSKDLVESGAVSDELNGKKINQPTIAQERQINSSGVWSTNSGYYSTIVDIENFAGEELTSTNECIQYAFLSAVGDTDVTFCSGCSRVTGYPSAETIPADCKYLYIYLARNNTDFPTLTVTGETIGLKGKVEALDGAISDEITRAEGAEGALQEADTALANKITDIDSTYGFVFGKGTTFGLFDQTNAYKVKKAIKSIVLFDPNLAQKKLILRYFGINDVNNNFIFYVNDTTSIADDVVPSTSEGVVDTVTIPQNTWQNYKGIVRAKGNNGKVEIAVDFDYLIANPVSIGPLCCFNNASIRNYILDYASSIEKESEDINAVIAPMRELKKYVSFNGVDAYVTLTEPIVLENNGDSLELDLIVRNTGGSLSQNGSYAFSLGGSSSEIAIGINKTRMCIRADDGTWIVPTNSTLLPVDTEHQTIRIEYADDKINTYRNDVLINSYSGLKKVTILGFGHGNDDYGYWDGAINNDIKVNGGIVNLIDNCTPYKVSIIYPDGFLTESQVAKIESSPLYVEKEQDVLHVYKYVPSLNKYIDYPMHHYNAAYTAGDYPSFFDVWRLEYVALCSFDGVKINRELTLFRRGEAELAICVPRGDDASLVEYVGGSTHGFENIVVGDNIRNIQFVIDNQIINETATFALKKVHSVEIVQKSELYQAYTNSNPFASVLKHWRWSEDKELSISTEMTMLRNIDITNAMFGMMCTYRHSQGDTNLPYLTSKALKENHPFNVFTITDGWESVSDNDNLRTKDYNCSKITLCGALKLGFSMHIIDSTIKSNGGMYVATNSLSYNKIYFDLTGAYSATTGEKLSATQEWMIQ